MILILFIRILKTENSQKLSKKDEWEKKLPHQNVKYIILFLLKHGSGSEIVQVTNQLYTRIFCLINIAFEAKKISYRNTIEYMLYVIYGVNDNVNTYTAQ